MSLKPVYNVVTEPVDDSLPEYTALEFFRACAANEEIPTRLTVTHLGHFLFNSGDDQSEVITKLHYLLRETSSIKRHSMIQFVVNGRLFPEEVVRLGIPKGRDSYEDIEIDELFVAPLEPGQQAGHFYASK
jgi:hypothetical protein